MERGEETQAQQAQHEQHAAITRSLIDSAIMEHTKQVIGDERRRADECLKEIQAALNKYDCAIVPRCIITTQGVEFQIETTPRIHPGEKQAREARGETFPTTDRGQFPQTPAVQRIHTGPDLPPLPIKGDGDAAKQEGQKDQVSHEETVRP